MHIIIHNKKYNITEFMNEHPGGATVFKHNEDLTQDFEDVYHSQDARTRLKNFLIEEDNDLHHRENGGIEENKEKQNLKVEDISFLEFLESKFNASRFRKLFTKEDKGNIHKILGVITLINYVWYYFGTLKKGSTYGIPNGRTTTDVVLSMIPAALLSVSSLQFNLAKNFTTSGFGILNNEFRNVNGLFVIRSILLGATGYIFRKMPNVHTIFVWGILMMNMFFREKITDLSNQTGKQHTESSAIRSGIQYWESCPKWFSENIRIFYSGAQITFNVWVLLSTSFYPNISAIFVLQLASFAGTLMKKGIIGLLGWHSIYIFTYFISFIGLLRERPEPALYGNTGLLILSIIAYNLRVNARLTRYALWTLFTIALLCWRNAGAITTIFSVIVVAAAFHLSGRLQDPSRKATDFRNIIQKNTEIVPNMYRLDISLKQKTIVKPGQFVKLTADGGCKPYTPVEWSDRSLSLYIKSYKGGISEKICRYWTLNSDVKLAGPYGDNFYEPDTDKLHTKQGVVPHGEIIMFCCGTGIAPFNAIVTHLAPGTKYKCRIYASFPSKKDRFLVDTIPTTVHKKMFYSNSGRITPMDIQSIVQRRSKNISAILICGTPEYNTMIKENIQNHLSSTYIIHTW